MDKIICSKCGKEIVPGNRPDGLPNGIGFETYGKVEMICTDCIIEIGKIKEGEFENDQC